MRYEDEIDRSRRRQSRGRETVKRSGNRNPASNRQKELTLITDSFREDARRRAKKSESIHERPEKASSPKKTSRKEEKEKKTAKAAPASSYRASAKRKAKKKRRKIAGAVLGFFLILGIVAFAGYTYLDVKWKGLTQRDEDWNPDELINLDISEEKQEQMEGYWTIAVFGLDSRNGSVGKGNNSDVNMICNIDLATGEIRMVSVYRDTYLNISDKNSYNKINAAFLQGGPTQAVKALNKNLDLEIDDYAVFNWKAVAEAINILGGVDIEITKKEFYYINAFITETVKATGIPSKQLKSAGMNHLDGVQAVAYGRLRLMDTDYERTERQRKVISLAFEKAKKADWATLNNIIQTLLVTEQDVDTSIELNDIIRMGRGITKLHLGESAGFPNTRKEGRIGNKGDCVIPNTLESNVSELHSFLFGDEDYEPSSQVRTISNKILSDFNGGSGAGKKKEPEKTTEAPETAEPSSRADGESAESGAYGQTGESYEYWYPWETDDDGATGPGKATRPYGPGQETGADGETYPHESFPYGESIPYGKEETAGGVYQGGGSQNGSGPAAEGPGSESSFPGNGGTEETGQAQESDGTGIIIYPGSGTEGTESGVLRPGTEEGQAVSPGGQTENGVSGSGSGSANPGNTPGAGSAASGQDTLSQNGGVSGQGGEALSGSTPGQNTDTGVIIGPGTGN